MSEVPADLIYSEDHQRARAYRDVAGA